MSPVGSVQIFRGHSLFTLWRCCAHRRLLRWWGDRRSRTSHTRGRTRGEDRLLSDDHVLDEDAQGVLGEALNMKPIRVVLIQQHYPVLLSFVLEKNGLQHEQLRGPELTVALVKMSPGPHYAPQSRHLSQRRAHLLRPVFEQIRQAVQRT